MDKRKKGGLTERDERRLLALFDRLAMLENNRLGHMVALIAGRRGIDKLPPHQQEQLAAVAAAMAGVEKVGRKPKGEDPQPEDE